MSYLSTISPLKIKKFQCLLLNWYADNGRSFLWRNKSATNYQLIISEVFLQRTKAETVAKFLPLFFKIYPSWKQLGGAEEDELKDFIKPLGLHQQRGSRLFRLAQELKSRKGRLPADRNEVEELPMMGQYIANAFELYVLNKRTPLLDVNMARLLERFFGPRKLADIRYDPYLQELAYRIVDHPRSKEMNWAVLDFCSLICKPQKPLCNLCLLSKLCQYFTTQK